jgi:hypothetical protein
MGIEAVENLKRHPQKKDEGLFFVSYRQAI